MRVCSPRRGQLLYTHVDMTKDVQLDVLIIDEVRLVDATILVIQHRYVLVRQAREAEVHHTFAVAGVGEWDRYLVANSGAIGTPDITADKNEVRLVFLQRQVEKYIVKCFLNVRAVKRAREVVCGGAPLSFTCTTDAAESTGSGIVRDKCGKAVRVHTCTGTVEVSAELFLDRLFKNIDLGAHQFEDLRFALVLIFFLIGDDHRTSDPRPRVGHSVKLVGLCDRERVVVLIRCHVWVASKS